MSVHVTWAVTVPKVGCGLVFLYANKTLASFWVLHQILQVLSHSHVGLPSKLLVTPESIWRFGKWTPPTHRVVIPLLCRVSSPTEATYSEPVLGLSFCFTLLFLWPSPSIKFVFVFLLLSVIFGSTFLSQRLIPHLSPGWKFWDVPLWHFTLNDWILHTGHIYDPLQDIFYPLQNDPLAKVKTTPPVNIPIPEQHCHLFQGTFDATSQNNIYQLTGLWCTHPPAPQSHMRLCVVSADRQIDQ